MVSAIQKQLNFLLIPLTMFAAVGVVWSTIKLYRQWGFSTNWGRIKYLVERGEFAQIMEEGTFPLNQDLPPHLRLDKLSYLDLPSTELAVPPVIDLNDTEYTRVNNVQNVIPESEKSEKTFNIGVFKLNLTWIDNLVKERYIERNLGPLKKSEEALEQQPIV